MSTWNIVKGRAFHRIHGLFQNKAASIKAEEQTSILSMENLRSEQIQQKWSHRVGSALEPAQYKALQRSIRNVL